MIKHWTSALRATRKGGEREREECVGGYAGNRPARRRSIFDGKGDEGKAKQKVRRV